VWVAGTSEGVAGRPIWRTHTRGSDEIDVKAKGAVETDEMPASRNTPGARWQSPGRCAWQPRASGASKALPELGRLLFEGEEGAKSHSVPGRGRKRQRQASSTHETIDSETANGSIALAASQVAWRNGLLRRFQVFVDALFTCSWNADM
jgi:hypothetical protein